MPGTDSRFTHCHPTPLLALQAYYRCPPIRRRFTGPPPAQPKLLRRRRYGQDARHFPAARRLHRSPTVTIPAIVPTAVVCVCGANNAVTRSISAVVCGSVAVRWGVPAVISRGIAAIVAVPRSAVVTVARAIGVGAGRYSTDHRTSN